MNTLTTKLTSFTVALAATTLLTSTALTAQGSVATLGAGCALQTPTPSQTPSIGHTGTPRIGMTFSLTYTGPNYQFSSAQQSAQPMLALGTQVVSVPLPPLNLIYQPSGCMAYVVPLSLTPMPPHPSQPVYQNSYSFSVPNNPALVGFQFVGQWLVVHQQCGFVGCGLSGLVTSDAAIVTIGT